MKTRQLIHRVPFVAPAPFGIEVMTYARVRAITPVEYLLAPQRPAFHILLFVTDGETTHAVDFVEHQARCGSALWVRPGQVQQFRDSRATAELVLFQPDFLIPHTRAAAIADDRFGPVEIAGSSAARSVIDQSRQALRRAYARAARAAAPATLHTETLRHLLSVLILTLTPDAPHLAPADRGLYTRFRDLLERDFAVAHDVDHYARQLGYSSRTLNRATQTAAGESPKQAINRRISLEAHRLLAHTDLPVATIARQTGFHDPSNFSSFFAHHTGVAPSSFRTSQRPPKHPKQELSSRVAHHSHRDPHAAGGRDGQNVWVPP